jgi:hypothetical protein
MTTTDDGRLKAVAIACGPTESGHVLYALTEDGRVWCLWKGEWAEETPIPDQPSGWRKAKERKR